MENDVEKMPEGDETGGDGSGGGADDGGVREADEPAEAVPAKKAHNFCPKCGTKLRPDAWRCGYCGKIIDEDMQFSRMRRFSHPLKRTAGLAQKEWADFRDIIIYYAVILGAVLLVSLLAESESTLFFINDIAILFIVLGSVFLFFDVLVEPLSKPGFGPLGYLLVGGGSIVTFSVSYLFLYILRKALMPWDADVDLTGGLKDDGYGFAVAAILLAVSPGILEEIAFRGVIFGKLFKHVKPWTAVIVSGIMFGIIHVQFINIPLFFMGIYFGWLRMKSGSVYPGMLAHFGHNLLCAIAMWYDFL
jgi:membrane protease YdiL (CAAX protease family)/ribosomal protein S27AE